MGITLYHYWRSSASWRVRWALELKGVVHDKVAVNLLAGEEKLPGYLKQNPSGYVPAVVVDGQPPLGESMAIMEWLEENYPAPSFFDGDSYRRAFIRQLAETINSGTQPVQNLDVMRMVSEDKERQQQWMQHWMKRGLGIYEGLLRDSGLPARRFSVSDHPTLADLCLVPQCFASLRFGVALADYPRCQAIYEYALTTSACAAAAPERFQPPG